MTQFHSRPARNRPILTMVLLAIPLPAWCGQCVAQPAESEADAASQRLIALSAEMQGLASDDQRAPDAFRAIYESYIQIEVDELALGAPKLRPGRTEPVLSTKLYNESWYFDEIPVPDDDHERWQPTVLHAEGWRAEREAAERLFRRFDSEGMTLLVDQALSLPGFVPRAKSDFEISRDGLSGLTATAQLERMRAELALESGDVDTAVRSLQRLAAIQRFLRGYPDEFGAFLVVGMHAYASGIARAVALNGNLSNADLGRIDAALGSFEAPSLEHVAEVCKIAAEGRIRQSQRQSGRVNPALFEYQVSRMNALIDDLVEHLTLPAWEQDFAEEWFIRWQDAHPASQFPDPVGTLYPAIAAFVSHRDAELTKLDGYRTLIGLERHRRSHGEPPESLSSLDPAFVPQGAVDRYALDGRFGYRRFDKPDQHGRLYTLYSWARDFMDDDGTFHKFDIREDRILGDYLFNRPAMNDLLEQSRYTEEHKDRMQILQDRGSFFEPGRRAAIRKQSHE